MNVMGEEFVFPLKLTLPFLIAIDKINLWKTTNEYHVSQTKEIFLSLCQRDPFEC